MDLLAWSGWIVAVISLLLNVWQYWKDRYHLVVNVRYLSETSSYIIEARNVGRRPISITGAGLGGVPSTFKDRSVYIWSADGGFPQRVEEGEATYFRVRWDDDVADREQAHHAWIRDASGRDYRAPLPPHSVGQTVVDQSLVSTQDSSEDLAVLFNLAVQRESILTLQERMAYVDAQVDFYEAVARLREEERIRKGDQEQLNEGDGTS